MAFLTQSELLNKGFGHLGRNVRLSNLASIYNPPNISFGDNCRIDDFTVLSAGERGISIGCYVHVSTHCLLVGGELITLCDFSGLSSHCSIFSSSDDFSGEWLTNPCVPAEYTHVVNEPVTIGRYSIVGSHTTILPGVDIGENCAVGANSLLKKAPLYRLQDRIYAGIPARLIGNRITINLFSGESNDGC